MPSPPVSPTRPVLRPARDTKQRRSRETLERILDAAERLLDERDFGELTMAQLAERAGCAVGTLYGRLPGKQSLLVCLHERYLAAGTAASEATLAACAGDGLAGRVRGLCRLIVTFFATWPGVTRAVTAHLFDRPGPEVAGLRRRATARMRQAAAFLAEKVDPAVHPDAQRACEFAVLAATEVAQSRLVFVERSATRVRFARKELEARLTAMVMAYLQHGGTGAGHGGSQG